MNKKTILTIVKLIPPVAAALSFILIFGHFDGGKTGGLTTATVLLGLFGFVFFFIGRKAAKEDRTLKILGRLDLLSTVAIIALYVIVLIAFAGGITDYDDAGGDSGYEIEGADIGSNIGTFASLDLEGNEVSDAIFADADVTVINVWATFCGPCIEEMPELAAWSDELPGNVQIVGVVIDTPPAGDDAANDWGGDPDNLKLAKQICDETGVKYTNILASGSVMEIFSNVVAVPTTFIVDRSGNIICSPFVGADVEGYKKAVEEYLAGL